MSELFLARDIALICIFAFIGGSFAKLLKLPLVIGYILSGIVLSFFLEYLIKNTNSLSAIADIGVALLLFSLGLEFSFQRLVKVKEIAIKGVFLQILLTTICFLLISRFWHFQLQEAIFFGALVSLSSTAIVVKILAEKGETESPSGEISINWLLLQDLAVFPLSLILPIILKISRGPVFSQFMDLFLNLGKTFLIIYLLLIVGKRIIPRVLNNIGSLNSRELMLIAAISLSIFSAYISVSLGLSFALGAFMAGLLLSISAQNHAIFAEIRPLRDFFSMIFFVLLGLFINMQFVFSHLLEILTLSLSIIILKYLIVFMLLRLLRYHFKIAHSVGLNLIQVGEFAFVLSAQALSKNIISANLHATIISVSLITIITTPFLINKKDFFYQAIKNLTNKFFPFLHQKWFSLQEKELNCLPKELPLVNHVVICGYGRVGKHIGELLASFNIPFIVIDINQHLVSQLKEKGIPVILGDPIEYGILDYAQVDKAAAVIIAVPDLFSQEQIIINSKNLNPNIYIICRSHKEEDNQLLLSKGAHKIIHPEFEASLTIARKLLEHYNLPQKSIEDSLQSLREYQEK